MQKNKKIGPKIQLLELRIVFCFFEFLFFWAATQKSVIQKNKKQKQTHTGFTYDNSKRTKRTAKNYSFLGFRIIPVYVKNRAFY